MADNFRFVLNEAAIADYLGDPMGPVGDLMGMVADQVAEKARAMAPVREGTLWNNSATLTSNARPPGFLKARIHGKRGVSRQGNLYGSANGPAAPLVWITHPATQIPWEHRNLFMERALYSTNV